MTCLIVSNFKRYGKWLCCNKFDMNCNLYLKKKIANRKNYHWLKKQRQFGDITKLSTIIAKFQSFEINILYEMYLSFSCFSPPPPFQKKRFIILHLVLSKTYLSVTNSHYSKTKLQEHNLCHDYYFVKLIEWLNVFCFTNSI